MPRANFRPNKRVSELTIVEAVLHLTGSADGARKEKGIAKERNFHFSA